MWWVLWGCANVCLFIRYCYRGTVMCGGSYGDVLMCVCLSGIAIEGLACVVGALWGCAIVCLFIRYCY